MGTIFMDAENSKPSDSHWLLLNLSDKTNLKKSDKCVTLSNFSIWKTQIIFFKYQLRRGMKSLDYLMDNNLYHYQGSKRYGHSRGIQCSCIALMASVKSVHIRSYSDPYFR